jgi:hypothetical protein
MSTVTYEAVVENGEIRLAAGVLLPDRARVYVVVPDQGNQPLPRVWTPRLARREDAELFRMEVREDEADAGV